MQHVHAKLKGIQHANFSSLLCMDVEHKYVTASCSLTTRVVSLMYVVRPLFSTGVILQCKYPVGNNTLH